MEKKVTGSRSGVHAEVAALPVVVAPTTTGKGFNKVRMPLIPIACWKLENVRFAFGSSFVLPDTQSDFEALASLRKQHPGAPMSIFGHADPVGDDAYNKVISGNRADSIYGVLLHDTAIWERLYINAGSSEGWGSGAIQTMLSALGYSDVRQFQAANALATDGVAGPKTREKLFAAYMQFLHPDKLSKSDFLARGADPQGKGDVQGCGEFNPLMVFSQEESNKYQQSAYKAERDAENEVNRRVLILLFQPGTVVPPDKWPCPRTSEGSSGCQRRLWSDGNSRRAAGGPERREFGARQDTFACRFYQRIAGDSPCERYSKNLVQLRLRLELDPNDTDHTDDKFTLTDATGAFRMTQTSAKQAGKDGLVDVVFTGIQRGVRYTLSVDPGAKRPAYTVFENLTYEDIQGIKG